MQEEGTWERIFDWAGEKRARESGDEPFGTVFTEAQWKRFSSGANSPFVNPEALPPQTPAAKISLPRPARTKKRGTAGKTPKVAQGQSLGTAKVPQPPQHRRTSALEVSTGLRASASLLLEESPSPPKKKKSGQVCNNVATAEEQTPVLFEQSGRNSEGEGAKGNKEHRATPLRSRLRKTSFSLDDILAKQKLTKQIQWNHIARGQTTRELALPTKAVLAAKKSGSGADPLARFSSLTAQEHIAYLTLSKLQAEGETHEVDKYRSKYPLEQLHTRVIAEQKEYAEAQYGDALKHFQVYGAFAPGARQQIEAHILRKGEELCSRVPTKYAHLEDIELSGITAERGDPVLSHTRVLAQEGSLKQFAAPHPGSLINTRLPYFATTGQAKNTGVAHTHWKKTDHPGVGEDTTLSTLLEESPADIVCSSSSLRALIGCMCRSWIIPFEVRVYQSATPAPVPGENEKDEEGEQKHHAKETKGKEETHKRTVFLGKCFHTLSSSNRDKNNKLYCTALKSAGVSHPGGTLDFTKQPSSSSKVVSSSQIGQQESKEDPTTPTTHQREAHQNPGKRGTPQDALIYNMWKFGPLKMLVRCKIHSMLAEPGTPKGCRYVGIRAKMEYRRRKGWEEITWKELADWWMYTFIRPDAHLLLGRINPSNGSLLALDRLAMHDILRPGCPFDPAKASKWMYTVLDKIAELPKGHYVMKHKPQKPVVRVYKCQEQGEQVEGNFESTETAMPGDKDSGAIDLNDLLAAKEANPQESMEYISHVWVQADTDHAQVPHTFPIDPSTYCAYLPKKYAAIKYCHNFARTGICKHPKECKYPHLWLPEVEKMYALRNKRKKKKKKKKRRKKGKGEAPVSATSAQAADGLAAAKEPVLFGATAEEGSEDSDQPEYRPVSPGQV